MWEGQVELPPLDAPLCPLDPSATFMWETNHVTAVNALALKLYAHTGLPCRLVNSTPCRSLVLSPIDPTHPPNAVKDTPDVSEQRTHDYDHFEVENSSPPSYMRHVPPHHSATSMACISSVPRSISPIFRSIDASPRVPLMKPHDR